MPTKVPPAISVLKVYDNNKFNCHNHAICKSKEMNLKALKIHVTSTSANSCFNNVSEKRMKPKICSCRLMSLAFRYRVSSLNSVSQTN